MSAAPKEQESPAAVSAQNTQSEGSCHLYSVLLSFQGTWLTVSAIRGMFPKRAHWQTARGVLAVPGEKEMRLNHQDTIVKARDAILFLDISISLCMFLRWMHFPPCFLHLCILSCLCFFCLFGGVGWLRGFFIVLEVWGFGFYFPKSAKDADSLIWSYFCGFCCLSKLQEKPWRRNKPPELPPNHPAAPAGWGNLKRQWAIWSTADHSRFLQSSRILLVEGVVWIKQKHDPQKACLHTLAIGRWRVPVVGLNLIHLAGTGQPGDPKESLWI